MLDFLSDYFSDNPRYIEPATEISNEINIQHATSLEEKFEFVLEHALDLLDEKRRVIGLFKDFLYEYPKQMNLLIMLYQMDICKELSSRSEVNDIFTHRFVKRLESEMGISKENAVWAVNTWCSTYMKMIS